MPIKTVSARRKPAAKPTFDRTRPVSWSFFSSFEYDPEQWYRKYVLGKPDRPSPEMEFGKKFADSCEARRPLAPVTLLSKVEQEFSTVFEGMPMIGFADTYDDVTKKAIGEFKTGVKPWDQKRVDDHGQITMYCLMNWLINKVRPEDTKLFLQWVPTRKIDQDGGDFSQHDYRVDFAMPIKVHTFNTKRTMKDVVVFGARIKRLYKEMDEYCKNHA